MDVISHIKIKFSWICIVTSVSVLLSIVKGMIENLMITCTDFRTAKMKNHSKSLEKYMQYYLRNSKELQLTDFLEKSFLEKRGALIDNFNA